MHNLCKLTTYNFTTYNLHLQPPQYNVVFPNRFNLMDFKHVNCKFLTSVSFKYAISSVAFESQWLLGRNGRPSPDRTARRNKGISISKLGKLLNITNIYIYIYIT